MFALGAPQSRDADPSLAWDDKKLLAGDATGLAEQI